MIIYNNADVSYVYTLPDGSTAEGQSTSNTVQTENLFDAVLKVKSTSRLFARQGDTATQTIVFTNNSAAVLTDMFLTDFMSEGATYTAGTVTVNGVSHPEHDMGVGFALPDLAPSESVTVAYDVLIGAITASAKVTNDAKLNFSVMDPARGKEDFEGRTNLVTIPVVADSMSVVKSVDKNFAMRGHPAADEHRIPRSGSRGDDLRCGKRKGGRSVAADLRPRRGLCAARPERGREHDRDIRSEDRLIWLR